MTKLEIVRSAKEKAERELRSEQEKTLGLTEKLKCYLDSISGLSSQLGSQKEIHAANEQRLRDKCEQLQEAQSLINLMEKQVEDLEKSNSGF